MQWLYAVVLCGGGSCTYVETGGGFGMCWW